MSSTAGIVVLLLSCIGNAELWAILMNRRHTLRYKHHRLRRARYFHDAGMLLFPPFVFVYAGLGEHGLLNGGTISELPASLQGILAITLLGLIPFFWGVARWQFRRPPQRQLDCRSTVHDVLAMANTESEKRSVMGDQHSLLCKLPLNQIFQLEIAHRTIRVRHSQPVQEHASEEKTVRIAHFSDVHMIGSPGKGFHDFVTDQLCEMKPDAFIFTGDMLDRQHLLPWAVDSFSRMSSVAPGYFILGNHDWHLDFDSIRKQLADTGWQDLGESHLFAELAGCRTLLAGTETPWIGENPQVPARADEDLRVLLSHAPDQRNYAAQNRFDLMLCGHNHGGQVVLPVIGPVYSPSIYGVKYAGGLFEHGEMLIHVSRGVGGKDRLRCNCRPEVTLLELRVDT